MALETTYFTVLECHDYTGYKTDNLVYREPGIEKRAVGFDSAKAAHDFIHLEAETKGKKAGVRNMSLRPLDPTEYIMEYEAFERGEWTAHKAWFRIAKHEFALFTAADVATRSVFAL